MSPLSNFAVNLSSGSRVGTRGRTDRQLDRTNGHDEADNCFSRPNSSVRNLVSATKTFLGFSRNLVYGLFTKRRSSAEFRENRLCQQQFTYTARQIWVKFDVLYVHVIL
jgi:hypothetical protein